MIHYYQNMPENKKPRKNRIASVANKVRLKTIEQTKKQLEHQFAEQCDVILDESHNVILRIQPAAGNLLLRPDIALDLAELIAQKAMQAADDMKKEKDQELIIPDSVKNEINQQES